MFEASAPNSVEVTLLEHQRKGIWSVIIERKLYDKIEELKKRASLNQRGQGESVRQAWTQNKYNT